MQSSEGTFLKLVRLGIGHTADALPASVDWPAIQALAVKQGLLAVVLDGIGRLMQEGSPQACGMDRTLKKQWIGQVLRDYEYRYDLYRRAIAELAGFYNARGFQMMVLKGYACSLDWPRPGHRPSGDIDIWLFGKYREADAALSAEQGVAIDKSHHHHTVFRWRKFSVENHYDFVNVHARRSSREMEKLFKELGLDDAHFVEVDGERVYVPSPDLHALFLLKHAVSHFASTDINLRQLLDWAFFMEKHGKDVDWEWLLPVLDAYHLRDFFNCVNAICVEDLGFDSDSIPYVPFDPKQKGRVLDEILSPEFSEESPKGLLPRLSFKYRRWKANAWKHEMCYNESRWSAFWSGIWNHLLKPSSI